MQDEHFNIFEDQSTLKVISAPEKLERRSRIEDIITTSGTRHEAVVPLNSEYTNLPTTYELPTAKQYNFELDLFQKMSLCALERDESVLVSAHTSSGKTVVAEYAIALALKNNQRVVYTSPIKALSNQKYRELLEEFKDVGLMTGDVTINPTASCLVMTTEILRNMLYRGSEVIREVHWAIFDEIHYMRDRERGVVWEETIILLPPHVRMVFLSATIPNALEFAEWISYIQNQVVHVVYTEKRVTPLVHYFRTDKLYKVKDTSFHKTAFLAAMRSSRSKRITPQIVKEAVLESALPVVVFSFRRKDCENFAIQISKDFLNSEEKEMVKTVFTNATGSLRKEDRVIPMVQNMLPLLMRGIGIHHSGLLPIVKEVVEILFQEGLLKVLFATETFSIGLNMPAKAVIFTALKKFDGESMRLVTSGEYIQMSGRAGRRGIDNMGIATSLISEPLTYKEVNNLFSSNSDILKSAFRLTYNMILNLMRVEGLDPLYLISRSFHHFQAYKKGIAQEENLYAAYSRIKNLGKSDLVDLLIKREEAKVNRNLELVEAFSTHLKKGRIVDIFIPRGGCPISIKNAIVSRVRDDEIRCMVLTDNGVFLNTYPLSYIDNVYDKRVKLDMRVFERKFDKISVDSKFDDLIKEFEEKICSEIPNFNFDACIVCKNQSPTCLVNCGFDFNNGEKVIFNEEIKINNKEKEEIVKGETKKKNKTHMDKVSSNMEEITEFFKNEMNKKEYLDKLSELNKLKEVYHMNECKKMINVLRRLEYCDETTVLIKGRMACEISAADELVLTEMIFNGDFAKMAVEDFVPLLSCLVFEESNDSENFVLSNENKALYSVLKTSVEKICSVLKSCNLEADPNAYLKKFSYELMDVVRMWVCGHTFMDICNKTEIFEGSIIRTFRRLEELLRQLSNASRVIGNSELENMFSLGIDKIKRDIIFAASLYL